MPIGVDWEESEDHRQSRAARLAELRRIAKEVSARAVLSEDEATALVDEAVRAVRED